MYRVMQLIFMLGAGFLVACSGLASTPVPHPTFFSPVQDPTRDAFYFGPEQKNDGKISMSIADEDEGCHPSGKPIRIRMTFQNLRDQDLVIGDTFSFIATNKVGSEDVLALLK